MLQRSTTHALFSAALLVAAASAGSAQQPGERYDLLIAAGSVLDGTGAPARVLDVAIRGDRIVAMAPSLPRGLAERVIDATGRVVSPAHSDLKARYGIAPSRSAGIDLLVPAWAREGGEAALRRRVADPALEDSILRGMVDNIMTVPGGRDLSRVQFSRVSWDTNDGAKTLQQLAECRNLEPTPENGARVVLEAVLAGGDSASFRVLGQPENASQKLAQLLANGSGAAERGVLRVGGIADLVVSGVGSGVETVVLGGEVVVEGGGKPGGH